MLSFNFCIKFVLHFLCPSPKRLEDWDISAVIARGILGG